MKIALYGGAFDPITTAHLQIVSHVITNFLADIVVIIPCYHSLKKKKMADYDKRITMCNIALSDLILNSKVIVSDIEKSNYEFDGLTILKKIIDNLDTDFKCKNDYYLIIGMDNAIDIHNWPNIKEILDMCTLYIVPRIYNNNNESNILCIKKPHIVLNYIPNQISSTMVRKNIRNSIFDYLTSEVAKYIQENNLYI